MPTTGYGGTLSLAPKAPAAPVAAAVPHPAAVAAHPAAPAMALTPAQYAARQRAKQIATQRNQSQAYGQTQVPQTRAAWLQARRANIPQTVLDQGGLRASLAWKPPANAGVTASPLPAYDPNASGEGAQGMLGGLGGLYGGYGG